VIVNDPKLVREILANKLGHFQKRKHDGIVRRLASGLVNHDVEFVIQILKKAAKLASEAEARRREAWAGAQRGQLAFPQPRDAWGCGGRSPPRYGSF
jgi:hypothetical protein